MLLPVLALWLGLEWKFLALLLRTYPPITTKNTPWEFRLLRGFYILTSSLHDRWDGCHRRMPESL
ncbi:hypothetical protein OBV_13370 [Oscillibacter valericigenes Sjm18-20]|nr:hypothetical protein OBV_13370 [Oscillibacter valericigenes Sjm18-20]